MQKKKGRSYTFASALLQKLYLFLIGNFFYTHAHCQNVRKRITTHVLRQLQAVGTYLWEGNFL